MSITDHKARWEKHKAAKGAKKVNTSSSDVDSDPASVPASSGADAVYRTWLGQCRTDWKSLKTISDHAQRNKKKPGLIRNYAEYLRGVLESDNPEQNDVLAMNIVWAADCGEWDYTLELADFAIKHGISLENMGFNSAVPVMVIDNAYKELDAFYKKSQADAVEGEILPMCFPPVLSELVGRIESGAWGVKDVWPAKLYKLMGLEAESNEDWGSAVQYFNEANKYPNVAVKTRLANAQKKLAEAS